MSFIPTSSRPFARGGWGGKAANFWRGAQAVGSSMQFTTFQPKNQSSYWRGQVGTLYLEYFGGVSNSSFTGTVRLRSNNSVVSGATINLMQGNIIKDSTVSDGSGNYTFLNPGSGPFFLNVYKVGSPDIFGTTRNDLYPQVV